MDDRASHCRLVDIHPEAIVSGRRIIVLCVGVVTLASLLWGCGKPEPLTPPTLHLGADVCARCGMMVSEKRFAGAMVVRDQAGRVNRRLFDDVGEMLLAETPDEEHRFYAVDFSTDQWIDADAAIYVHSRGVMTPMATGVIAFVEKHKASDFAKNHNGDIYSFVEARRLAAEKKLGVDASASPPIAPEP